MKHLLYILILGLTLQSAQAGYLFLKLVDERERLVKDAQFYWKYPDEASYRAFGDQGIGTVDAYSRLQRYQNYTQPYNYRLGKSSSPTRMIDLKIVAPGYEVQQWSQTWPNRNPGFQTIVLNPVRSKSQDRHEHRPRKPVSESITIEFDRRSQQQIRWPTTRITALEPMVPDSKSGYWAYNVYGEQQGRGQSKQIRWKFLNDDGAPVTQTHRSSEFGLTVEAKVTGKQITVTVTFPES
ncbi:hypothetical protein [Cerasicoccus maritimus]|uniref:hypothetical protein n=1 Tax=Cerasicoccus maritimus TaxID=490089 RepID=UPI00285268A7|nr:hypothetical protein [Cerasicoccus maritimus]